MDDKVSLRPRVNNNSSSAPRGMLAYDRGALSHLQQNELNNLKTPALRWKSIRYLDTHPQVGAVASVILRAILLHRPANPKTFVKELVKRPDFPEEIERYLVRNGSNTKKKWCPRNDDYESIHPDLLTGKKSIAREKSVEVLTAPNRESSLMELVKTLIPMTSTSSTESVDSLEIYSGRCVNESKMTKSIEEAEEIARKVIAERIFKRGKLEESSDAA